MKLLAFFATLVSITVWASEGHEYYHQGEPQLALNAKPAVPKLVSPAALSSVSGAEVDLKWEAVAEADAYSVQVSTDPGFFSSLVNEGIWNSTDYKVKGLEAGKIYYWRVASLKTGNKTGAIKSNYKRSSFKTN